MQADNSDCGFSYGGRTAGHADEPVRGEPAWQLLDRLSEDGRGAADGERRRAARAAGGSAAEGESSHTTHGAERLVRVGLSTALPNLTKTEVKMSVRRTFRRSASP